MDSIDASAAGTRPDPGTTYDGMKPSAKRGRQQAQRLAAALFAFALGLFAQFVLMPSQLPIPAVGAHLLAGALLVWSLGPRSAGDELVPRWPATRSWRLPLALALAGLFVNAYSVFLFARNPDQTTGEGWPAFFVSLLLLLAAAIAYDRPEFSLPSLRHFWRQYWLEILAVLILTTIALLVRAYRLDEIPYGVWIDEAGAALSAKQIVADTGFRPIIVYMLAADLSLAPYVVASGFALLGDSVLAMRLPYAVIGALMAPAFYLLARSYFSFPVAALATALVAVSRWHFTFSRFAMVPVATPLFGALAFFCLIRATRTSRLYWYVLSGIFLSAGMWFYMASRFVVIVAVVYLAFLFFWRGGARRGLAIGGAAMLLTVAVTYSPLALHYFRNPDQATNRMQAVTVFGGDRTPGEIGLALARNTAKHLLAFQYQGDPNGRHNVPGEPLLDPLSAALMVLGVAVALSRRGARRMLLFTWLLLPLLGGIVTLEWEAPHASRSFGAYPAVFLLVGMGIDGLWSLTSTFSRTGLRFAWLALLTAGGIAGVLNANLYFRSQMERPDVWDAHSTFETIAAYEIKRLGDGADMRISDFYRNSPTVHYLTPEATKFTPLGDPVLDAIPTGRTTAYLLDPKDYYLYQALHARFPTAVARELRHPRSNEPGVFEVILSANDKASAGGLLATYTDTSGFQVERHEAEASVKWLVENSPKPPFRGTWTGTISLAKDGSYAFGARSEGPLVLAIDGKVIATGTGQGEGSVALTAGLHFVQLEFTVGGNSGSTELFWRPPGAAAEVIPRDVLVPFLSRTSQPVKEIVATGEAISHLSSLTPLGLRALDNNLIVGDAGVAFDRVVKMPRSSEFLPVGPLRKPANDALLANGMRLVGYSLPATVDDKGRLPVTLLWDVPLGSPRGSGHAYNLFAHLMDSTGRQVAVQDLETHDYASWRDGDLFISQFDLAIPKGLDGRLLWLDVGAYSRAYRAPVPWVGPNTGQGSSALRLGPAKLAAAELGAPQRAAAVTFGNAMELTGYSVPPEVAPGKSLELDLWWRANAKISNSYVVSVQILDRDGKLAAQHDAEPRNGSYPTAYWDAGETVVDHHTVPVPALPTGDYSVSVVVYARSDGTRLAVSAPGEMGLGTMATITTLEAKP